MTPHAGFATFGLVAFVTLGGGAVAAGHHGSSTVAVSPDSDYVAQMAAMHMGEAPAPNAAAALPPRMPVQGDDVTYGNVGGTALQGYLVHPAGMPANSTLPGVIIIHEWWGLNDNIRMMARRIAGEGYTVLAVDLYGGKAAATPDSAKAFMQAVVNNPQSAHDNLHAAVTYMHTTQHVKKLGVWGWCFGGGWSLQAALDNGDQVNADVVYYGQPELDPHRLANLHAPLLALYGGADPSFPPDKIHQMETSLDSLGKTVTIKIYPGAKHAFANPSGPAYDAQAADDAWKQTTAFLAQYLQH